MSNCTNFYEFSSENRVGVWYEFVGNGRCLEASTESSQEKVVGIFTGTCDDLICAREERYSDYFRAEEGVTYRIAVTGESYRGPFTFSLQPVSSCVNEICVSL